MEGDYSNLNFQIPLNKTTPGAPSSSVGSTSRKQWMNDNTSGSVNAEGTSSSLNQRLIDVHITDDSGNRAYEPNSPICSVHQRIIASEENKNFNMQMPGCSNLRSSMKEGANAYRIVKKEWHRHFNPEVREDQVKKFKRAIHDDAGPEFNCGLPLAVFSVIGGNLDDFARRVETYFYLKADSEIEYYYLLKEKSCEILKKIGKNRNKMMEQDRQAHTQMYHTPQPLRETHMSQNFEDQEYLEDPP